MAEQAERRASYAEALGAQACGGRQDTSTRVAQLCASLYARNGSWLRRLIGPGRALFGSADVSGAAPGDANWESRRAGCLVEAGDVTGPDFPTDAASVRRRRQEQGGLSDQGAVKLSQASLPMPFEKIGVPSPEWFVVEAT